MEYGNGKQMRVSDIVQDPNLLRDFLSQPDLDDDDVEDMLEDLVRETWSNPYLRSDFLPELVSVEMCEDHLASLLSLIADYEVQVNGDLYEVIENIVLVSPRERIVFHAMYAIAVGNIEKAEDFLEDISQKKFEIGARAEKVVLSAVKAGRHTIDCRAHRKGKGKDLIKEE